MNLDSTVDGGHPIPSDRRVPAIVAQAGLVPLLAALSLHVVSLVVQLVRNGRLREGIGLADIGLDFSTSLAESANVAVAFGILVAAGTFLAWFFGAYSQLAGRQNTRYAPLWAVLGWFVPGLNAVRPIEIMSELVGSKSGRSGSRSRNGSGNGLIAAWWGLWLFGAAIIIALRFFPPANNDEWAQWFRIAIAADVALITSLLAGLALIGRAD